MKTINVRIERNVDGFGVYAENEVFTGMGDTLDMAVKNMVEGIDLYVEAMREAGLSYPSYLEGDYGFEFKYDMQSMVAYYAGIIGFAGLEKITGIHQKQLGSYARGESTPRKEQTDRFIAGLHRFGTELKAISV
ncbi:transcriptional regulator [Bacteroidia bacterium]|nr:transcriptional regulator [Bacteroidia bacterium]